MEYLAHTYILIVYRLSDYSYYGVVVLQNDNYEMEIYEFRRNI